MSHDLPAPWQRRSRTARGGVRRAVLAEDVDRMLPHASAEQRAALVDGTFFVEYVTNDDGSDARIELPVMDNFGEVWLWALPEPSREDAR